MTDEIAYAMLWLAGAICIGVLMFSLGIKVL